MPSTVPTYLNDGSGRDTFINHAGAYWLNPLPGGTYHGSLRRSRQGTVGLSTRDVQLAESIDPLASKRLPAQELFGKSRYTITTTTASHGGTAADGMNTTGSAAHGEGFDPAATALATIPEDVANAERRLRVPGHATTGLEGTGGASTYTGTKEEWVQPQQVDNTLLRLRPTYESTCHYSLRTSRVYMPDDAPPPQMTLLEKRKSRYL